MSTINNNLTKKQKKVFKFIGEYFQDNGESPTIFELKEMLKVKSLRTVTQYLDILERKGFIQRNKHEKRGIVPIGYKSYSDSEMTHIRVLGSAGCDNLTIVAEQDYDEYISISKEIIDEQRGNMVGIRAIGNSMLDSGISDKDIVLVKKTQDVNDNDRVVAIIDGIAVIKRIAFGDNVIILNPDSKDETYKPIIMDKNFEIFGKVIDVIKKPGNEDIEIVPEKNY